LMISPWLRSKMASGEESPMRILVKLLLTFQSFLNDMGVD